MEMKCKPLLLFHRAPYQPIFMYLLQLIMWQEEACLFIAV